MLGFLRRKDKSDDRALVLSQMDGRQVKYVTKRIHNGDGGPRERILGKEGRIAVIDGEIRIMCGGSDVFRCNSEEATFYTLLSGDGITVSGVNSLNGEKDELVVYYTYYRK